jgi:hypothetical protein
MELGSEFKPILSSAATPQPGTSSTATKSITINSFFLFMASLLFNDE